MCFVMFLALVGFDNGALVEKGRPLAIALDTVRRVIGVLQIGRSTVSLGRKGPRSARGSCEMA